MAEKAFLTVLKMSLKGSVVILAVLVLRLALKKAPKIFSYILWTVVAFRLLCPFSFSTPFGMEISPPKIYYAPSQSVQVPNPSVGQVTENRPMTEPENITITEQQTQKPTQQAANANTAVRYTALVWMRGIFAIGAGCLFSTVKLKRNLRFAVKNGDMWECEKINTPFVSGFLPAKIYIPYGLSERRKEYIFLHENHHIKRCDHIFKPIFFAATAIHWFNPLVWLAFLLMCRDMEMSCDEAVVKNMGEGQRADYCACLLNIAAGKMILPLAAFEEGDAKIRIKNLSTWKKPARILLVLCMAVCATALIFLAADKEQYTISDIDDGAYNPFIKDVSSVVVNLNGVEWASDSQRLADLTDQIHIDKKPIDQKRDTDRPTQHSITVNDYWEIYFHQNCERLWIDNGIKPSFTYKIKNPRHVKQMLDNLPHKDIPLTVDSAQQFIQDTLASLSVHADQRVSFSLPGYIPVDHTGKVVPSISLSAVYSEKPGYYSNHSICELKGNLERGELYYFPLPETDEQLVSISMSVRFEENLQENTWRNYAFDHLTISVPFEYEKPAGYAVPSTRLNQKGDYIQADYTFKNGTGASIGFDMPMGWSGQLSDDKYTEVADILLFENENTVAKISLKAFGTEDIRALKQLDTGKADMPGEIFSSIMLSSMAWYEDYQVIRNSESGRVAVATLNYKNANQQTIQQKTLLVYDWQICHYFVQIVFENSTDRSEHQIIADSITITNQSV